MRDTVAANLAAPIRKVGRTQIAAALAKAAPGATHAARIGPAAEALEAELWSQLEQLQGAAPSLESYRNRARLLCASLPSLGHAALTLDAAAVLRLGPDDFRTAAQEQQRQARLAEEANSRTIVNEFSETRMCELCGLAISQNKMNLNRQGLDDETLGTQFENVYNLCQCTANREAAPESATPLVAGAQMMAQPNGKPPHNDGDSTDSDEDEEEDARRGWQPHVDADWFGGGGARGGGATASADGGRRRERE